MLASVEAGESEAAEARSLGEHANDENYAPDTLKRNLAYVSACFACLGSGTIYAWSAYSTALSTKMHYDQRASSVVASFGAYGLFLLGILFGPLIDDPRIGPRKMCFAGGCLLVTGYFLLATAYKAELIGQSAVVVVAMCLLLVGAGSSACCMSSMAVVAQSFGEKFRGLAMSIPLGLLGLSALVFAGVKSIFTEIFRVEVEATYKFLVFLAIMTGGGNCLSSLGLRIVRPIGTPIDDEEEVYVARIRFLPEVEANSDPCPGEDRNSLLNNAVSVEERERTYSSNFQTVFMERDSRLLFSALFLVAGVGLSYITSLGKVVQLLLEGELSGLPVSYTPQANAVLQQLQSAHVALFSLSSFTGRIFFGALSDVALRKGLGRGAVLIAAGWAMLFAVGSAATIIGGTLSRLWLVTGVMGLSYGAVFGVGPTLVGEEVIGGVRHFGRNWGVMSWAPPFGNQLLSFIFGIAVDAARGNCKGYHCFAWSFAVDAAACATGVALLLAFQRGYGARRMRRQLDSE